jgi:hypothetical protein
LLVSWSSPVEAKLSLKVGGAADPSNPSTTTVAVPVSGWVPLMVAV